MKVVNNAPRIDITRRVVVNIEDTDEKLIYPRSDANFEVSQYTISYTWSQEKQTWTAYAVHPKGRRILKGGGLGVETTLASYGWRGDVVPSLIEKHRPTTVITVTEV